MSVAKYKFRIISINFETRIVVYVASPFVADQSKFVSIEDLGSAAPNSQCLFEII
jgi:hypothetical protein